MTDLGTLRVLACKAISREKKDGETLFDTFLTLFNNHYTDRAVGSMKELKVCPNQQKGKAFELFCYQYLKTVMSCSQVYLWADIPHELKEQLSLWGQDMGIDIIAYRNGWYAVQCKYKKPSTTDARGNIVSWSSISTFAALVTRTGPWAKHVIMTTGTSIRRAGGMSNLDMSVCRGTFRKLNLQQWYQLFDITSGNLLSQSSTSSSTSSTSTLSRSLTAMSIDDIRQARLRHFASS